MEEFIRETFSQIVEGVKEAQLATKESGTVINTPVDDRIQANKVSFEVLLTNTE